MRLYERDEAALAGVQKLRFFAQETVGGRGARLRGADGRWRIDLSAAWGAASLGYGHPALVAAVTAAVSDPAGASVLSSANGPATALAEALLACFAGESPQKVWLGHSGSDANECALRVARQATGRPGILAFRGAYHGGSAATIAISGHSVQEGSEKLAGLIQIDYPDRYRDGPDAGVRALERARAALAAAPVPVAACFLEPIQSDGGMLVPPPGFLAGLARLCRQAGILVVSDEVKVGLGRTGALHAHAAEGFRPDILVLGKGLGGGLPLSAVIGPAEVMDCATAFAMQTLHGNPVSAAAGLAVLDTLAGAALPAAAARQGARLRAGLERLAARHALIGDVRGRGLALGVELVGPDKAPARAETAALVRHAHALGLVLYYVGMRSNVLELTPPLILADDEADEALAILDRAFTDLAEGRIAPDSTGRFAGW